MTFRNGINKNKTSVPFVNWFPIFPSKLSFVVLMVSGIRATREYGSASNCRSSLMPNRDNAIYDFSKKAVENGLDIFRVFDSLNYFGACRDL